MAIAASRATWVSSPTKAISVAVPGFRPALIPEPGLRVSALDVGGEWIAVGSFLAIVLVIGGLLAAPGPRGRFIALAAAFGTVALLFGLTTASFAESRARSKGLGEPQRRTGVIMLTIGGAFVAVCGSVSAMLASPGAPSLRLPEKPPGPADEVPGEEGRDGTED